MWTVERWPSQKRSPMTIRSPVGADHAVVAEPGLGAEGGVADHRARAPAPDRTGREDRQDAVMGQDQLWGHGENVLRIPVASPGVRGHRAPVPVRAGSPGLVKGVPPEGGRAACEATGPGPCCRAPVFASTLSSGSRLFPTRRSAGQPGEAHARRQHPERALRRERRDRPADAATSAAAPAPSSPSRACAATRAAASPGSNSSIIPAWPRRRSAGWSRPRARAGRSRACA